MLSSRDFVEQIRDDKAAVKFFQDRGVLRSTWACPSCGEGSVRLKTCKGERNYRFKCSKCKCYRSLFSGSWFHCMKLTCLQVVDMLFAWAGVSSSRTHVANEGRVRSAEGATDWVRYIREVCATSIADDSDEQIDGEGCIVEIDETMVTRRKYNRGRLLQQIWVFGGVERVSGRCFFEVVADRTETTLLEIIKRRICAGTTVISDCHRSYANLSRHGFVHLTMNHSENFIDPETGAHTQTIESLWGALKRFLRSKGRNIGPHLEEYIAEFLYRRKHDGCIFEAIVSVIARYYPPSQ